MSCPSCGGTSRAMLSPGYFQCTSIITRRDPTGAHPSGAFGPAYQDFSCQCGHRYQEGTGQAGQQACIEHALFAVGLCIRCRRTPVCGRCPQQACASCRAEERDRRAKQEAKALAAQRVEAEERRELLKAAHDADVQTNAAKQPYTQEYYRAELKNIDVRISAAGNPVRGRGATGGTIFQAVIGAMFVLFAVFILMAAPATVKMAFLGPSAVALILLGPNIAPIRRSLARSRQEALRVRKGELLAALGCGQACQFGCRTY